MKIQQFLYLKSTYHKISTLILLVTVVSLELGCISGYHLSLVKREREREVEDKDVCLI